MVRAVDHFGSPKRVLKQAALERHKWFIAAKEQHKKRDDLESRADDAILQYATSVVMATDIEIKAFHAKLDKYDTATTQALMLNSEQLAIVQNQLNAMLDRAFVMKNGRRVFKSEDGKWAVDEHGNILDSLTENMEAIPQTPDTAESYLEALDVKDKLLQQRQELHDYQSKLDEARERADDGSFEKAELGGLNESLEDEMPEFIKLQFPDYAPAKQTSLKRQFAASVNDISNDEMSKTLNVIPIPREI